MAMSIKVINEYRLNLASPQANEIYESIVRRMKDPAILEYAGRRLFRARIFPIPAKGDVRVKLSYSQSLTYDAGLYTYRYPLSTNKYSPKPLESLVIKLDLRSERAVKSVYSPTHKLDVDKKDDHHAVAGFEASHATPDKDFVCYYTVSEKDLGISAVSYRRVAEDGFFLLLVAPELSVADRKPIPKDVAFVFDTSGSMAQGRKIDQARRALRFCLESLRSEDRFAIVDFSTTARSFRSKLVPVDPKTDRPSRVRFEVETDTAGRVVAKRRVTAGGTVLGEVRRHTAGS
jgi:Ca-activated chloride channel family protein